MARVAVRVAIACGVKVIVAVQVADTASGLLETQVFVSAKSDAFVPESARPEKLSVLGPALVRVKVLLALVVPSNWLVNESLVADKVTVEAWPFPLRFSTWGELDASSLTVMDP